ncbi:sensor histidine kinase [Propionivibrio sp.]|uniref:sensor histidine kinase n=1 Tax=Propionivibrio sp. TaxID=2212460 RepID=UPI003BF35392
MDFVDLAAFAIHDVKNRLAVMASRAEEKGDSETLRGALEAAATLTRLLACYKAEKGSLGIDIDARTPADLLDELSVEIGKQTALTVHADPSAAPTLWFYDECLVRMVLLDALYNALRHARQQVLIAAREHHGWLEFTVRDDGPGYPESMLGQPVAMQPLSREGTGLGLHLAGRVAALHSNAGQYGYIELGNEDGAVFRLLLPR